MDRFENWFNKINEDLNEPAVSTAGEASADVDVQVATSSREDMLSDVDTIMQSLETLADELTEDYVTTGDIAAGAAVAGGAAVGAALLIKKQILKKKVQKTLNKVEDMKTQAEKLKDAKSKESDPAKKKGLQDKIEKLETAAKELKDATTAKYKELDDKIQQDIDMAKAKAKAKKATEDKPEDEPKDKKPEKKDSEVAPEKNSKEDKLSRLNSLMDKAKKSGESAKVKKIQDLIDKVSAKESWQLDDTTLGQLLESEIKKLEMEFILNENKSNSIMDRFSKLI